MKQSVKVIVYVRAADARSLREDGKDPAVWIRELVRFALDRRREEKSG